MMNIKELLLLAAILGCMANNTFAMEVKLDAFWQQVKDGKISPDSAAFKLKLEKSKLDDYKRTESISEETYNKAINTLFTQAANAGIKPSLSIQPTPK